VGRRGRRATTIGIVLGGVLAIAVPVVLASHQFADVPSASPHHEDISAIRGAGITAGCAPGLYCPDQFVRRDQMATFLRRGLGRVALGTVILDDTVGPAPTSADDTTVAQVAITVPGAGTAVSQFVKLDAHVTGTLTARVDAGDLRGTDAGEQTLAHGLPFAVQQPGQRPLFPGGRRKGRRIGWPGNGGLLGSNWPSFVLRSEHMYARSDATRRIRVPDTDVLERALDNPRQTR
jgi:hypothetical protein